MPEVISLEDIRKRDADAGSTWFKEPPLGACGRAFIDRRFLLKHIDQLPQQAGDEGACQREIRRLRTALNLILGAAVPLGSDSGHHGIEMVARGALDGSFVEPKTSPGPMPDWARLLLECRDALPAITLTAAKLRGLDLTLAARIEAMLEPWKVKKPPSLSSVENTGGASEGSIPCGDG